MTTIKPSKNKNNPLNYWLVMTSNKWSPVVTSSRRVTENSRLPSIFFWMCQYNDREHSDNIIIKAFKNKAKKRNVPRKLPNKIHSMKLIQTVKTNKMPNHGQKNRRLEWFLVSTAGDCGRWCCELSEAEWSTLRCKTLLWRWRPAISPDIWSSGNCIKIPIIYNKVMLFADFCFVIHAYLLR